MTFQDNRPALLGEREPAAQAPKNVDQAVDRGNDWPGRSASREKPAYRAPQLGELGRSPTARGRVLRLFQRLIQLEQSQVLILSDEESQIEPRG